MTATRKKAKKNPIAQAMANIRWSKSTKAERLAEGKRLADARRRRRQERSRKA